MVGGRGRGHCGQVLIEKVPHHDHNFQDVMIEDLWRQVVKLTQRLVEQDFDNHEVEGHDFDASLENSYHNHAWDWEYRGRKDHHGGLNFKMDLPEFSGTL